MGDIFHHPNVLIIYRSTIVTLVFNLIFTYIFFGFAFMKIAKKLKLQYPGLSWIPFIGPTIIAYKASKMHWCSWILIGIMFTSIFINNPFRNNVEIQFLIELVITTVIIICSWKMFQELKKPGWWALLLLIPTFIINDIQLLILLVSTAMVIVWSWKMFEKLKRPGWWALLFFIPIVNFVIIGIAAWSDKK